MIGDPNSGKTFNFLSLVLKEPVSGAGRPRRAGRWRFLSADVDAVTHANLLLKRGKVVGATAPGRFDDLRLFGALTVASKVLRSLPLVGRWLGSEYSVCTCDASGELIQRLAAHVPDPEYTRATVLDPETQKFLDYLVKCDGLLCALDPVGWDDNHRTPSPARALDALNDCRAAVAHAKAGRRHHRPPHLSLRRARGWLALLTGARRRRPFPVAVLLTKADQLLQAPPRHQVDLPASKSLTLEYFVARKTPTPRWLRTGDGQAVQFDLMEALAHPLDDLVFAESVAWDFLWCNAPQIAEGLMEWNLDPLIAARPYLVSSYGKPPPRSEDGSYRFDTSEAHPVRTADPIRSVLDRLHDARVSARGGAWLAAACVLVVALIALGPLLVRGLASLGTTLVDRGHDRSARSVLWMAQAHPCAWSDTLRPAGRVTTLAAANQHLAASLRAADKGDEGFGSALAAANRAVALCPESQEIATWRDALLTERVTNDLERNRPQEAFEIVESSSGRLSSTPAAVDLVDRTLTEVTEEFRRNADALTAGAVDGASGTPASGPGRDELLRRIDQVERFVAAVRSGRAFLDRPSSDPQLLQLGQRHQSALQAVRSVLATPAIDKGQVLASMRGRDAALGCAENAHQLAIQSGDERTIAAAAGVRLDANRHALRAFAADLERERLVAEPQVVRNQLDKVQELVAECPSIGVAADQVLTDFAEALRTDARDTLRGAAHTPIVSWPILMDGLKQVGEARRTDPREAPAIDLLAMASALRGEVGSSAAPAGDIPDHRKLAVLRNEGRRLRLLGDATTPAIPLSVQLADKTSWDIGADFAKLHGELKVAVDAGLRASMAAATADQLGRWQQASEAMRGDDPADASALVTKAMAACLGADADYPQAVAAATASLTALTASDIKSGDAGRFLTEMSTRLAGMSKGGAPALAARQAIARFVAAAAARPELGPESERLFATSLHTLDEQVGANVPALMGRQSTAINDDLVRCLAGPIGRRHAMAVWLAQVGRQEKLDEAQDALLLKLVVEAKSTAPVGADVGEVFHRLVAELAQRSIEGAAGEAGLPARLIEAAKELGADDAKVALESFGTLGRLVLACDLIPCRRSAGATPVYLGRTELTIGQYRTISGWGGVSTAPTRRFEGPLVSSFPDNDKSACPALGLTQAEAHRIASLAGARLPTMNEWLAAYTKPASKIGGDPRANGLLHRAGLRELGDVAGAAPNEVLGMNLNLREWVIDGDVAVLLGASWYRPDRDPTSKSELARADDNDTGVRLAADAIPAAARTFLERHRDEGLKR